MNFSTSSTLWLPIIFRRIQPSFVLRNMTNCGTAPPPVSSLANSRSRSTFTCAKATLRNSPCFADPRQNRAPHVLARAAPIGADHHDQGLAGFGGNAMRFGVGFGGFGFRFRGGFRLGGGFRFDGGRLRVLTAASGSAAKRATCMKAAQRINDIRSTPLLLNRRSLRQGCRQRIVRPRPLDVIQNAPCPNCKSQVNEAGKVGIQVGSALGECRSSGWEVRRRISHLK